MIYLSIAYMQHLQGVNYTAAKYRIAGKFGGELNLAAWRIAQPTAKLKSSNIKSILDFAHAKAIVHCEVTWWVWSLGLLHVHEYCFRRSSKLRARAYFIQEYLDFSHRKETERELENEPGTQ